MRRCGRLVLGTGVGEVLVPAREKDPPGAKPSRCRSKSGTIHETGSGSRIDVELPPCSRDSDRAPLFGSSPRSLAVTDLPECLPRWERGTELIEMAAERLPRSHPPRGPNTTSGLLVPSPTPGSPPPPKLRSTPKLLTYAPSSLVRHAPSGPTYRFSVGPQYPPTTEVVRREAKARSKPSPGWRSRVPGGGDWTGIGTTFVRGDVPIHPDHRELVRLAQAPPTAGFLDVHGPPHPSPPIPVRRPPT